MGLMETVDSIVFRDMAFRKQNIDRLTLFAGTPNGGPLAQTLLCNQPLM